LRASVDYRFEAVQLAKLVGIAGSKLQRSACRG
jgi:hypothetical protein